MNGRHRGRRADPDRDAGLFAVIPHVVMQCAAYLSLSYEAKALLPEFAMQVNPKGGNNGMLRCALAEMRARGWHSAGKLQSAKQELLDAKFIFETVKGHRPHKASCYAVTWRTLDKLDGYDMGTEQTFERGAYRYTPGKPKRAAPTCRKPSKNAVLIPAAGIEKPRIVPTPGIEASPIVPTAGAIRPVLTPSPIPIAGILLDKPSAVAGSPAVLPAVVDGATSKRKRPGPRRSKWKQLAEAAIAARRVSDLAASENANDALLEKLGRRPSELEDQPQEVQPCV